MNQWYPSSPPTEEKRPRAYAAPRGAASATAISSVVEPAHPNTSQGLVQPCACDGKGYVFGEAGYCPCATGVARQAEEQAWALARIWAEARIPAELAERRIAGWPGDSAVRDYLLTWVSAWQGKQGPSLVLTGRARSGKTGLVLGLAYSLVEQLVAERVPRFALRFVTAYDLMAALSAWQGREERFRQYLECDLLILDDLGREPAWDSNVANLTRVVMHRYNHQLPLMVTSNLSFGEIEARFGKDGDAVTGRLREMARGFVVEGFGE
jgi:DNA replication protein DnaC